MITIKIKSTILSGSLKSFTKTLHENHLRDKTIYNNNNYFIIIIITIVIMIMIMF